MNIFKPWSRYKSSTCWYFPLNKLNGLDLPAEVSFRRSIMWSLTRFVFLLCCYAGMFSLFSEPVMTSVIPVDLRTHLRCLAYLYPYIYVTNPSFMSLRIWNESCSIPLPAVIVDLLDIRFDYFPKLTPNRVNAVYFCMTFGDLWYK